MIFFRYVKEAFNLKLKDNEFCNCEPCWCGKCQEHYRQNFIKALKSEGIEIIGFDEKDN